GWDIIIGDEVDTSVTEQNTETSRERLRKWYLAHLRRLYIKETHNPHLTPQALIKADQQAVERLISPMPSGTFAGVKAVNSTAYEHLRSRQLPLVQQAMLTFSAYLLILILTATAAFAGDIPPVLRLSYAV